MANQQQRKLQKRKARDEKNKKAKLHRQAVATKKRQEENAEHRKMKRVKKLQREMGKLSVWADDVLMKLNDSTLTQLEKNAKILKALEEEYEKESKRKRDLNDDLERKGLSTLQDKIKHLHDQLVEDQKAAGEAVLEEELALANDRLKGSIFEENESGFGPGGSAECRFTVNKPPVEVADVSVTKAPGFEEADLKENQSDS